MSKYNWNEIKAKYETGNYSMEQLANNYGFNRDYGYQKANKENWKKGKTKKKLRKKTTKKILDQEADREVKLRNIYNDVLNSIRDELVEELFSENCSFDRLKQLKISSETLRNCRKEQWEVNEVKEVAKKVKQEIEVDNGLAGDKSAKEILAEKLGQMGERQNNSIS
ncbi:hypothetical protein [Fuchsiella alkaliacetigena]|uniref:hypothetical protein n=1 Tax=Fuchsiella alkaliacetigena TaxID=957042 RepID=UPI00200ACA0F|nr:hypothetical protein [Fuchsiella alkaliacetigena]MCK8823996.1 hypothetical protein [Fuchsiella alkaliacetigena]